MASKGVGGGHSLNKAERGPDRGNYGGDPKRRRGRRGRGKNPDVLKEKEPPGEEVEHSPVPIASAAPINRPPKILTKQGLEKMRPEQEVVQRESRSQSNHIDSSTPFKIKTRSSTPPGPVVQLQPSVTLKQPIPGSVSIVTSKVSTPLRVNVKEADTRSRPVTPAHSPRPFAIEVPVHKRLVGPPEMEKSIKLVDEHFNWCENGLEMLQDHSDYLVIGVLGLQGSGKSTLMSYLAGNKFDDNNSSMIFRPQSTDTHLIVGHETNGIDLYVTKERIFILDTQPILSSSVLDRLLSHEKTLPPEYTSSENYAEMQSLQIASFLMTVCHNIVLVVDWFPDQNLLEFLKRAEMLKPATPAPPPSQSSDGDNHKDLDDYYPFISFAFNKASREDFHPLTVRSAEESIARIFKNSRLKYKGCCSLARSQLMPSLSPSLLHNDINLFIIPDFKGGGEEQNIANIFNNGQSILYNLLPVHFKGHPSKEVLLRMFRNQVYASARPHLTHTTLSEKNWFHYAARTWETLRKSSLMTDFNRLLT